MIPIVYLGKNEESDKLRNKLIEKHIKFIEKKGGNQLLSDETDKLVTEIRSIRPKLASRMPIGTHIEWKYYKLAETPIIKTDKETLPAWYIKENMEKILNELKANQKPDKKKLKIKRIRKNMNAVDYKIYHTAETEARINVTILRAINGINITDIVNEFKEEEKAAFMIAWRLSQHMNANNMKIVIDMIKERIGDIDV